MKLMYKENFDEAKKYWRAFWEKEVIDRPLVCVTSPKDNMQPKMKPSHYQAAFDGNYGLFLSQHEEWVASVHFGGEAIPSFECSFGPDQVGGFLGAEMHFSPENNTSWATPYIKDWDEFNLDINFLNNNELWKRILNYIDYCSKFAEGKFLVNMLDLHSNMDALSAIRGPQNLCIDIMDYPVKVHEALTKVMKLYPYIVDSIAQAGDMNNRGYIGWAPTYSETKFAVTQCDFSCLLSPRQAKEFVIPAIAEEAAYLDHSVYHYDGKEALGHLDDVLAIPDIDVIQWVPGDGNPRTIFWMDLLRKIQNTGKGLWIQDWTIDEIKANYKELRPEGLIFSVEASSQKEGEDLIKWLKDNT